MDVLCAVVETTDRYCSSILVNAYRSTSQFLFATKRVVAFCINTGTRHLIDFNLVCSNTVRQLKLCAHLVDGLRGSCQLDLTATFADRLRNLLEDGIQVSAVGSGEVVAIIRLVSSIIHFRCIRIVGRHIMHEPIFSALTVSSILVGISIRENTNSINSCAVILYGLCIRNRLVCYSTIPARAIACRNTIGKQNNNFVSCSVFILFFAFIRLIFKNIACHSHAIISLGTTISCQSINCIRNTSTSCLFSNRL